MAHNLLSSSKTIFMKQFLCSIFFFLFLSGICTAQGQSSKQQTSKSKDTSKLKPAGATIATAKAQPAPAQSIYYDALALYYALAGYKAYPIFLKNTTKTVNKSGSNPNPDDTAGKTKKNPGPGPSAGNENEFEDEQAPDDGTTITVGTYMIVESSSGKTLNDACDGDTLASEMSKYKYAGRQDSIEKNELINTILARNEPTSDTSVSFIANVRSAYLAKNNSFLFTSNNLINVSDPFASGSTAVTQNIPDVGKGLPSVAQLAEGLAEFYIQQLNAEISEAFFVRMKEILSNIDEIKVLFPNTLASLSKLEVTQYQQSLNALKAAFENDIKSLLSNLPALASLPKYDTLLGKYPELTVIFAGCDMISQIKSGHSVAQVLYGVSRADYIQKVKINDYSAAIKLAALMSWSVTDLRMGAGKPTNLNWVKQASLNALKTNPGLFQVFMGLFTEQAAGIKIGDFDFQDSLTKYSSAVLSGRYLVYNILTSTDAISNILANQTSTNPSIADRAAEYIDIVSQILNLANECLGVLPSSKTVKERALIEKMQDTYLPIIKEADSVAYSIEQKQYSNAVYQLDTLIGQLFPKAQAGDARSTFLHYGLFIAAIAEAGSATDVKSAISAFALPTGSSRIKKQNKFSWGLNGYVGIYHSWNSQYPHLVLPNSEWGITAPLGLGFNWGHFAGGGAFSIYLGIIDIGAIFAYKVNSDNSVSSSIQLGQLLAPSVGFVYGFPVSKKNYNLPFSFGVNYQWGPKLQSETETGASILPLLAGRFTLFLAVDIPVVNFHVTPFKS
jgi:hypothetical protein